MVQSAPIAIIHCIYDMHIGRVLLLPFLLIGCCITLTVYCSLYLQSYIQSHHLSDRHAVTFIIHQNVNIFNEICVVFIVALDLLNAHHFFKQQRTENKKKHKPYLPVLQAMDQQSSRISLMSFILLVLSWGFVMYLCMEPCQRDKDHDIKTLGFSINGTISMLVFVKYTFERLSGSTQIVRTEICERHSNAHYIWQCSAS